MSNVTLVRRRINLVHTAATASFIIEHVRNMYFGSSPWAPSWMSYDPRTPGFTNICFIQG